MANQTKVTINSQAQTRVASDIPKLLSGDSPKEDTSILTHSLAKRDDFFIEYSPVNRYNKPTSATKLIRKDENGSLVTENLFGRYPKGWAKKIYFDDLNELYQELYALGDKPGSLVMCADTRFDIENRLLFRRKTLGKYPEETVPFCEGRRRLLVLDVDHLNLKARGVFETVDILNLKEVLTKLIDDLIPELNGASYIYQLSSSCGIGNQHELSAHIWFLLTTPLGNPHIKNFVKAVNSRAGFQFLDPALYNAVQPIFTANPRVAPGVVDVFGGKRLVLVERGAERIKSELITDLLPIPKVKLSASPLKKHSHHRPTPTTKLVQQAALKFMTFDEWLGYFSTITSLHDSVRSFTLWLYKQCTDGLDAHGFERLKNALSKSPRCKNDTARLEIFFSSGEFSDLCESAKKLQKPSPNHLPKHPDEQDNTSWQGSLKRNKQGGVINKKINIQAILSNHPGWVGVLGYNSFTGEIVKRKSPPYPHSPNKGLGRWTDTDNEMSSMWIDKNYDFEPINERLQATVIAVSMHNPFNPVYDDLVRCNEKWLKAGAPKGYATKWAEKYLGAQESKATRLFEQSWVISAVARVFEPGCKADNVLILEGKQGFGKSTALSILGGEWFNDAAIDFGDKDSLMRIHKSWIIEMSELDNFKKSDSDRAKSFFSRREDDFRVPYGRNLEVKKRQCVFAGTTNTADYLKDSTGNRRYMPIECLKPCDVNALKADRDFIWGEAVQMYKDGEPWWYDDTIKEIQDAQNDRFAEDVWADKISEFLAKNTKTTIQILLTGVIGKPLDQCTKLDRNRMADVLRGVGWKMSTNVNIDGRRMKGWIAPRDTQQKKLSPPCDTQKKPLLTPTLWSIPAHRIVMSIISHENQQRTSIETLRLLFLANHGWGDMDECIKCLKNNGLVTVEAGYLIELLGTTDSV